MPTGIIGQRVTIEGSNFSSVDKVLFPAVPEYVGGSFQYISDNILIATVPDSGQWGYIKVGSSKRQVTGVAQEFFVPNPIIQSVPTLNPIAGSTLNISGLGFSGVTGAFFGTGEILGTVLTSDITDINILPIQVPSGHIDGPLNIVGQSGLTASVSNLRTNVRISGVAGTGYDGGSFYHFGPSGERHGGGKDEKYDDVIISGHNVVTGALLRASDDPSSNNFNHWLVDFGGGRTGFGISGASDILTGKVPSSAASGKVRIVNNYSNLHTGGSDFYVVPGPPTINSSSPLSGVGKTDVTPATIIKLEGSYFNPATGLYVYPTALRGVDRMENLLHSAYTGVGPLYHSVQYTSNSEGSEIQFTLPTGTGRHHQCDIVVETARGSYTGQNAVYIKYPPFISGFDPLATYGGQTISVTGSGFFSDSTKLYFSGLALTGPLSEKIQASIISISGEPEAGLQIISGIVPELSDDTNYSVTVDNEAAVYNSSAQSKYFGFFGPPIISGVFPLSGNHGDTIVLSGKNLVNPVSLSHNEIPISTFSSLDGVKGTGISFTIPTKENYLAGDIYYRNTSGHLKLTTIGGEFTTAGVGLKTIPDNIFFSGHTPTLVARNQFLATSGRNLELVTGVLFTGIDGTQIAVKAEVASSDSILLAAGNVSPKTGLVIRIPDRADDGKPIFLGEYSSSISPMDLEVFEHVRAQYLQPGTGIFGDVVVLSGADTQQSKYWFQGYTSGTLDMSATKSGEFTSAAQGPSFLIGANGDIYDAEGELKLNKYPLYDFVKPLEENYVTGSDGSTWVELTVPNALPEYSRLFSTRKDKADAELIATDYFDTAMTFTSYPVISGSNSPRVRVGETFTVMVANGERTFPNFLGISGTGMPDPLDLDDGAAREKEIEFVSKFNTRHTTEMPDGSDSTWFNLGDALLPNSPFYYLENQDPMGHVMNANARKHLFTSGLLDENTLKTGVYEMPVTVSDNFIGTGFLFLWFDETSVYEWGTTPLDSEYNKPLRNLHAEMVGADREYSTLDVNQDGQLTAGDVFSWSGETPTTNFHKASGNFYSGFSGTHTHNRLHHGGGGILLKETIIIEPEVIEIHRTSPRSGYAGQQVRAYGTGLANITGYWMLDTGYGVSNYNKYALEAIAGVDYNNFYFNIPSNFPIAAGTGWSSGYLFFESKYSSAESNGLSNGEGWLTVVQSPKITGFAPTEGVEGQTAIVAQGDNLHYTDTFQLVSNLDGDVVNFDWGKLTDSEGATYLTGLTPSGIVTLPQDYKLRVTTSAAGSSAGMLGDYTIYEGDLDIYGTLRVHGAEYVREDLDVSGQYLLDGSPLESVIEIPNFLPIVRDANSLYLTSEHAASYNPRSGGATWFDLARYHNSATLYGTPTFSINEFVFDGADDYAEIPADKHLNPAEFTLGILVKPLEAGGTIASPIVSQANEVGVTNPVAYEISYDASNRFYSTLTFTDSTQSVIYSEPVSTGIFYPVDVTWDGTSHELFISGKSAASDSVGSKTVAYAEDKPVNILTNSTHSKSLNVALKSVHLYEAPLADSVVNMNTVRQTTIQMPQRELQLSGGAIKVTDPVNPDKYTKIEGNRLEVTGDNAKILIKGVEIKPASDYIFQNIESTGDMNFEWTNLGSENVAVNFGVGTGISTLADSKVAMGNGTVKVFELTYTEDDINNIWVSLDGINLTPETDYSLVGLTGIELTSTPAVDEEVLIRHISKTITPAPNTYNLTIASPSGDLTLTDLSTGTQITFTGEVGELTIGNYNIYDSNVSITGSVASVRNEYSGISTNIHNYGTATATNIFNEPGSDTDAYSNNPNVFVANEGTVCHISGGQKIIIYSNTGAGTVYISGGEDTVASGNVTISGGTNTIFAETYAAQNLYGTNTIMVTGNVAGDVINYFTGQDNYVTISGTGELNTHISGSNVNIMDSTLTGVNITTSALTVSGGGVLYATGNDYTYNISGGTNSLTSHDSATITSNGSLEIAGTEGTIFNISGSAGHINNADEVTVNLDTGVFTSVKSTTVNVTGQTIEHLSISGAGSNTTININTGNLSFSGNYFDTNTITVTSGNAFLTGISFDIRSSDRVYGTGYNMFVSDSSGVFSGENFVVNESTVTIHSSANQDIWLTGGHVEIYSGTATVTGNIFATSGGQVDAYLTTAEHISFNDSTGNISTASGSVFVTGCAHVNVSGSSNYITGTSISVSGGTNIFTGRHVSVEGGNTTIYTQTGEPINITGGVNTVHVSGGANTFTGAGMSIFSQIIGGSGITVSGDYINITGVVQSLTGASIIISGNSNEIQSIVADSAAIEKGITTVTSSTGIVIEGTVQTVSDNTIENLILGAGSPSIYKGSVTMSNVTGVNIDRATSVTLYSGHAGITGSPTIFNNSGIINVTGLSSEITSTGLGNIYVTGTNISITGNNNYITGIVNLTGFITGSTVTITGDQTVTISGGTSTVNSASATIIGDGNNLITNEGTLVVNDGTVSLLNAGNAYLTGDTFTVDNRPSSSTSITGHTINISGFGATYLNNATVASIIATGVEITGGIITVSGTNVTIISGTTQGTISAQNLNLTGVASISGGTNYITGIIAGITGGQNYITGVNFYVSSGNNYITGTNINISGGAGTSINITGSNSNSISVSGDTINAQGNETLNITGSTFNITGSTLYITGTQTSTFHITGNPSISGGSHFISGEKVYITGGYSYITGDDISIQSDSAVATGALINITGVTQYVTGQNINITGNANVTGGQLHYITGAVINVTDGTSYITGDNIIVTGGSSYISGTNIFITGDSHSVTGNTIYITGASTTVTGENFHFNDGSTVTINPTNLDLFVTGGAGAINLISGTSYVTGTGINITGGTTHITGVSHFDIDTHAGSVTLNLTGGSDNTININNGASLVIDDTGVVDFSKFGQITLTSGNNTITGCDISGISITGGTVYITGVIGGSGVIISGGGAVAHIHNTGIFHFTEQTEVRIINSGNVFATGNNLYITGGIVDMSGGDNVVIHQTGGTGYYNFSGEGGDAAVNTGLYFRAQRSGSDQSLAANVYERVEFNNVWSDDDDIYDDSNYKFTVYDAGTYLINVSLFAGQMSAGKYIEAQVHKNVTGDGIDGTASSLDHHTEIAGNRAYNSDDVSNYYLNPTISTVVEAEAGDSFEVYAYTNETNASRREIKDEPRKTYFLAQRLSSDAVKYVYANTIHSSGGAVHLAGYGDTTFSITGDNATITGANVNINTTNLTANGGVTITGGNTFLSGTGYITGIAYVTGIVFATGTIYATGEQIIISSGSTVYASGNNFYITGVSAVTGDIVNITGVSQNVTATSAYITGVDINITGGTNYISGNNIQISGDNQTTYIDSGIVTIQSGSTVYVTGQHADNTFQISDSINLINDATGIFHFTGGTQRTTITNSGEITISGIVQEVNYYPDHATIDGDVYVTGGTNSLTGNNISITGGTNIFTGDVAAMTISGGENTFTLTSGQSLTIESGENVINVNSSGVDIYANGYITGFRADSFNYTGSLETLHLEDSVASITLSGSTVAPDIVADNLGAMILTLPKSIALPANTFNVTNMDQMYIVNSGILNVPDRSSGISITGGTNTIRSSTGITIIGEATIAEGSDNVFNITGTVSTQGDIYVTGGTNTLTISTGYITGTDIKITGGVNYITGTGVTFVSGTNYHTVYGNVTGISSSQGITISGDVGTITVDEININGGTNQVTGLIINITGGNNTLTGSSSEVFHITGGTNTITPYSTFTVTGDNMVVHNYGTGYMTGVNTISGGTNYITGNVVSSIGGTNISYYDNAIISITGGTNYLTGSGDMFITGGINYVYPSGQVAITGATVNVTGGQNLTVNSSSVNITSGISHITGADFSITGGVNYITGNTINITGSVFITGGINSITGTGISVYSGTTYIVEDTSEKSIRTAFYTADAKSTDALGTLATGQRATGYAYSGAEPTGAQELFVSIDGLIQNPDVDYYISGSYVNFHQAPDAGEEIEIRSFSTSRAYSTINISAGDNYLTGQNQNVYVDQSYNTVLHHGSGTATISGGTNSVYNQGTLSLTGTNINIINSTGIHYITGSKVGITGGSNTIIFQGQSTGIITGQTLLISGGNNFITGGANGVTLYSGVNYITGGSFAISGGINTVNLSGTGLVTVVGDIQRLSLNIGSGKIDITGQSISISEGTNQVTGEKIYITDGTNTVSGSSLYVTGGTNTFSSATENTVSVTGGQTTFISGTGFITGIVTITGGINEITGNTINVTGGVNSISVESISFVGGNNSITGTTIESIQTSGGNINISGTGHSISITGGTTTIQSGFGFTILSGHTTINNNQDMVLTGLTFNISGGTNFITGSGVNITGGTNVLTGINVNIYSGINTITAEDGRYTQTYGTSTINLAELGKVWVNSSASTHVTSGISYIDTESLTISGGINYITGSGAPMYFTGAIVDLVAQSGVQISITGGETTISNSGNLTLTPNNLTVISGHTFTTGSSTNYITGGTNYITGTDFNITGGTTYIEEFTYSALGITGGTSHVNLHGASASAYITGAVVSLSGGTNQVTGNQFTIEGGTNTFTGVQTGIVNITGGTNVISSSGTVNVTGTVGSLTSYGALTLDMDAINISGGTNLITGNSIGSVTITGDSVNYLTGANQSVVITGGVVNLTSGTVSTVTGAIINISGADLVYLNLSGTGQHREIIDIEHSTVSITGFSYITGTHLNIQTGTNYISGGDINVNNGITTVISTGATVTNSTVSINTTGNSQYDLINNSTVNANITGTANFTGAYNRFYITGGINTVTGSGIWITGGQNYINTGDTIYVMYSDAHISGANNLYLVGDQNTVSGSEITAFTGNKNLFKDCILTAASIHITGDADANMYVSGNDVFITGGDVLVSGSNAYITGVVHVVSGGTNYITGGNFYVTGGTNNVTGNNNVFITGQTETVNTSSANITGTVSYISNSTAYITGQVGMISGGNNFISGTEFYITGASGAVITGNTINVTGAEELRIYGHDSSFYVTGISTINSGTHYVTGDVSINAGNSYVTGSTVYITEPTSVGVTGNSVHITGGDGAIAVTGETVNITSGTTYITGVTTATVNFGEVHITGGTSNITGVNSFITGGTNVITGNLIEVISGVNSITGQTISITGGTADINLTGSNNASILITGGITNLNSGTAYASGETFNIYSGSNAVTGNNISIYSGTVTLTGEGTMYFTGGNQTITATHADAAVNITGSDIQSLTVQGNVNSLADNMTISDPIGANITGNYIFITGGTGNYTGENFYITGGYNRISGVNVYITGSGVIQASNAAYITGGSFQIISGNNYITGKSFTITGGENVVTGADYLRIESGSTYLTGCGRVDITGGVSYITGNTFGITGSQVYITGATSVSITGTKIYLTGTTSAVITGSDINVESGTTYITGGGSRFSIHNSNVTITGGTNYVTGTYINITGANSTNIVSGTNVYITGAGSTNSMTGSTFYLTSGTNYISGTADSTIYVTGLTFITGGTHYVSGTTVNISGGNGGNITGQTVNISGGTNYVTGNVFTITSGQHFITNTDSTVMHITGVVSVTGGTNYISGNVVSVSGGSNNYITGDTVNISGGEIYATGETFYITSGTHYITGSSINASGENFYITGGTHYISGMNVSISGGSESYVTGQTVNISGGEVYATGGNFYITSGTHYITGSSINASGENFYITGGTHYISGMNVSISGGSEIYVTGDTVNISGGQVYATGQTFKIISGTNYFTGDGATIYVTGGNSRISGGTNYITGSLIAITGGTNYLTGGSAASILIDVTGGTNYITGTNVVVMSGVNTNVIAESISVTGSARISGGINYITGQNIQFTGGTGYITGNIINITGAEVYATGDVFNIRGGTSHFTGVNISMSGGTGYISGGTNYITGVVHTISGGTSYVTGVNYHITGGTVYATGETFNVSGTDNGKIFITGYNINVTGSNTVISGGYGTNLRVTGNVINVYTGSGIFQGTSRVSMTGGTAYINLPEEAHISGIDTLDLTLADNSTVYLSPTSAIILSGIVHATGNTLYITGNYTNITGGPGTYINITGGTTNIGSGLSVGITGSEVFITGGQHYITGNTISITGGSVTHITGNVFMTGTANANITGQHIHLTGSNHYITGTNVYINQGITGTGIYGEVSFVAILDGSQTIANNSAVQVQFDDDSTDGAFDVGGKYNTSNYRFIPGEGIYHLSTKVKFNEISAYNITTKVQIRKNGTTIAESANEEEYTYSTCDRHEAVNVLTESAVGDYFEVFAYHNHGSSRTLNPNRKQSYFQGHRIGGGISPTTNIITGNIFHITGGASTIEAQTAYFTEADSVTVTGGSNYITGTVTIVSGTNAITGNIINITGENIKITGTSNVFNLTGCEDVNITGGTHHITGNSIYITGGQDVSITGGNVYVTGGINAVTGNILSLISGTNYITGGALSQINITGDGIQITGGQNYITGQNINITGGGPNYISGGEVYITGSDAINQITGNIINIYTGNAYITGGAGSQINITGEGIMITGGQVFVTGNYVNITGGGPNYISGNSVYVTGEGNHLITGLNNYITSGHNVITGSTNFVTGNYTNVISGLLNNITGQYINVTGGVNQITGYQINATGVEIDNRTGTITFSGTDTKIINENGVTNLTGTNVQITGGIMYITGSIDSNSYNITGSTLQINYVTGASFNITGASASQTIVNITGDDLEFNSSVSIHTGSLNNISNIYGGLNLRDASQGTFVNPTISQGDVTNFGILQINGDVTFAQTSGNQITSGIMRYYHTGATPTGTLDSMGTTGQIAYDTGFWYVKVASSGWLRSRLYPWGESYHPAAED